MTMFLVAWEIDIEADSPEEAAREALRIMRDASPDNTAKVFQLHDKNSGSYETIDLTRIDEEREFEEAADER